MTDTIEAPLRRDTNSESAEYREMAQNLAGVGLSVVTYYQALKRWVLRCGQAAGGGRLSYTDWMALILLYYRDEPIRSTEMASVFNIDDLHVMNYANKRLVQFGLLQKSRQGKEVFFSLTEEGFDLCRKYHEHSDNYLMKLAVTDIFKDLDFRATVDNLDSLISLYEQASRAAVRNI
jgi:predicted MarR family transcription regulator